MYSSRPPAITQSVSFHDTSLPFTTRPTTNPPAPTLIVLGPLNTDYTTVPTKSTPTRRTTYPYKSTTTTAYKGTPTTLRPILITRKPSVSTTITHNISISGTSLNNNQVYSTSFISVNVSDGTTASPNKINGVIVNNSSDNISAYVPLTVTKKPPIIWTAMTTLSQEPSFHLKPQQDIRFPITEVTEITPLIVTNEPHQATTPLATNTPCEDETADSNVMVNFPPVRHPYLNGTMHMPQEKPGDNSDNPAYPPIIDTFNENEIPTPSFTEDDDLTNKVDSFVNKIVESLQGNFDDLQEVVYTRKNVTSPPPAAIVTKKPASSSTKRPASKPTRPTNTKRPTSRPQITQKPSKPSQKPKPTGQGAGTRRPTTVSKRPKPTKKTTSRPAITEPDVAQSETTIKTTTPTVTTTSYPEITPNSDHRSSI